MNEENGRLLRIVAPADLPRRRRTHFDAILWGEASAIVRAVQVGGDQVLRDYARRFDGLTDDQSIVCNRAQCDTALSRIPTETRECLVRVAARIRRFAEAQREKLTPLSIDVPGGHAGHDWLPVERAGCYAPGGRYPLVSSVLMTVIPARTAGVKHVTLATPNPTDPMLAAAAIAGADVVVCCGGAHAIAALAYGTETLEPNDVIAGPGNQWVTAAKQIVSADVRIDMLAGPSELVVLSDDSGDARWIAADLLAQAEHDIHALPILISTCPDLPDRVEIELARQLVNLPTGTTAREALSNGNAMITRDLDEAIAISNSIAPEHLHVVVESAQPIPRTRFVCGSLFDGSRSAEVFGDFGFGPNHVLPTGGGARSTAGLSVQTFMRAQTWLRVDERSIAEVALNDVLALAQLEGLPGHANSAALRM